MATYKWLKNVKQPIVMDCLGTTQAVFCTSYIFPSFLTEFLTGNLCLLILL